jgi:hypothetical protein
MITNRTLIARQGGLALSSQQNPLVYSAKARATFLARFEVQVDPNGDLEPVERARRALAARKLYFSRLALKSAQARRRRAQHGNGGAP